MPCSVLFRFLSRHHLLETVRQLFPGHNSFLSLAERAFWLRDDGQTIVKQEKSGK
jgi:hypothetical protein